MEQWLITLIDILVVIELTFVNMAMMYRCLNAKFSRRKTFWWLLAAGVIVTGCGFLIVSRLPFYGNGNGLFLLLGFVYLIPLKLLYKDSLGTVFAMICATWVFTLSAFSISVQVAAAFSSSYFSLIVLGLQTLLLAAFFVPFARFVRKFYHFIYTNSTAKIQKYVIGTSVMVFLTLLIVHFSIVMGRNRFLNIAAIVSISFTALISYVLLYEVVKSAKNIASLQHSALKDELTGALNRKCFNIDGKFLLEERQPFWLIFLDLDFFKKVNDDYGHEAGDRYLTDFTDIAKSLIGNNGRFYRFAGDEFVVILNEEEPQSFIERLKRANAEYSGYTPKFMGLSAGAVRYLGGDDSLDRLLSEADKAMYDEKASKR